MPATDTRGLLLYGLDGSNPLAFLAAAGTLRTADLAMPDAHWRMNWLTHSGAWVPAMHSDNTVSVKGLVDVLFHALRRKPTPEFEFARNLSVSSEVFRKVAEEAQCHASRQDHRYADFATAFGCETIVNSHDKKSIQDTALRTMSGAGHQHFLGTMKQLVGETEADHLHKSLFQAWDYYDEKLGLRWDPEEDRRYALRWDNPSGDVTKTVRGANRLAIEALPLFPTAPGARRLMTTGFSRRGGAVLFTWPIWGVPLGLEVVRSLLALAELQAEEPDRPKLHSMGVIEVYRSERINVERYRNFTRALPA